MTKAKKEQRMCGQCWQHGGEVCRYCNRHYCYWFRRTKHESDAASCEAFNPRISEDRKHRDENAEIFEKIEVFWKLLREILKLSKSKAWKIVYHLQNDCRVITDEIELCDSCGDLFLSDREGVVCANESGPSNESSGEWDGLPRYWRDKKLCGKCLSEKTDYAY